MQARYFFTSLHRVQGFRLAVPGPPVALIQRDDANAIFASSEGELNEAYIQSRAAARLLAQRLFGAGRREERRFNSFLEQEIDSLRTALDGAPVLAIETRGIAAVNQDAVGQSVEWNGWRAAVDAFDKSEIRKRHTAVVQLTVSALELATEVRATYTLVDEGAYCVAEDGTRVLSYALRGNVPRMIIGVPSERFATADERYRQLQERRDLNRVAALAAQASATADVFRSWLAGWSALEVFVHKRFPTYEHIFLGRIGERHTEAVVAEHFDWIKEAMSGRFNLVAKFRVIAACLYPKTATQDIRVFRELKKQRDLVMHGQDVPEGELMASQLRDVLRRYIDADLRGLPVPPIPSK